MIEYFISAIIVGFLGGAHCFGMCGPIVSTISITIPKEQTIKFNIAYNLGRIFSYITAGVIAGSLSMLLIKTGDGKNILITLRVLSFLMMIAIGLYISGLLNLLKFIEKLGNKIWKHIEPTATKFFPFTTIKQAFIAGVLWGFIPCGLVYGVLALVLTSGSPSYGAIYMLGFGIGTLPALVSMGIFSQKIKPWLQNKTIKLVAGLLLATIALLQLVMFLNKVDTLV